MPPPLQKHMSNCSHCKLQFELFDRTQLGAVRSGRDVFCSADCRNKAGVASQKNRPGIHQCGPCPTCNSMFQSRSRDKTFCSMTCYLGHPDTKERLRANNHAKRLPETACQQCGSVIKNRHKVRKYCSQECRRIFFAERFDRYIANPETLALPQCYDEFFLQDELPCLVDGCDWVGVHLSYHCNVTHGIPVEKLRELAGFNRTTGLVTAASSDKRSAISKKLSDEGRIGQAFAEHRHKGGSRGPRTSKLRLEGKEHLQKSSAIINATESETRDPVPCRECGTMVIQKMASRRFYCSVKCRNAFYDKQRIPGLVCAHCKTEFAGKPEQHRRQKKGLPVCCSSECRNTMNIHTCLLVRPDKRRSPQSAPDF